MATNDLNATIAEPQIAPRPRGVYRGLWFMWAAVLLLICATGYVAIQHLRQGALTASRRDMTNLGVVLAAQTSRTIQSIDLVLRAFQARSAELSLRTPAQFRQQMVGEDTRQLLVSYLKNLPQAETLSLVDADGRLLNWARAIPVPNLDLSDRDYFRYLRDHKDASAFISGPSAGRATGEPIVLIVRRIDGPDGAFLGLIAGVIDTKYLEDFYRTIDMPPGQSVRLRRRDGVLVAGYPDPGAWRGRRMPADSPWYQRLAQGGGSFDAVDELTGARTIFTVHPLRDYPLAVDTNVSEQLALANWRQDVVEVVVARLGIASVFTALFVIIGLQFRRQENHARELSRAAEKLRVSERQVRDFAEISSDWFWEQDADLRFCWLSGSALLTQAGDSSYIGKTRWELTGQDPTQPPWPEHIADVTAMKRFRDFRYQLIGPDGCVHHISASGVPVFDASGGFIGYRGTARDVTAEVAVAEELRRSKDLAEAANRAKSEFLANMSHELRTPLNAIIGFSELMHRRRSGRAGDEHVEWAGDIMASGRHLLDVINDVLELARIEAGRYVLAQDRVDLAIAVRACLTMVRLQAEEKRVALESFIADREIVLRADGRAVRQILLNLLTNAVKFTPGGGTVSVRGGRAANGDVILVVADTGIGIDAAVLASIGEPFTQADASINRTYGGTGLGLSISRKLIALHGGELTIESIAGAGTTVRVIFPAARAVPQPGHLPADSTTETPAVP